jgi:hypothetical protein
MSSMFRKIKRTQASVIQQSLYFEPANSYYYTLFLLYFAISQRSSILEHHSSVKLGVKEFVKRNSRK